MLTRHQADASWMLLDDTGRVAARCSLWWRHVPEYPGHRLGLIGHFAAHAPDAATQLLSLACDQLSSQGCSLAVAPLDGNTWRQYRLITERSAESSFFLEPDHPDDWPAYFSHSGFCPLSRYVSTLNSDPGRPDARLRSVAERVQEQGIEIRPVDLERFEGELRQIYRVAVESCRDNFLFTPISACEFVLLYRPVRPYVRPELVLLAETQGSVIGFVFAIPDVLQSRRGCRIDTVILKTLCVLPEYAGKGLGSLLVSRCQEIAACLGYRRVIHALMQENNISKRISSYYTRPIRRYALFARHLGDTRP
jgi:GNAT superfamily N-acetyltransferase